MCSSNDFRERFEDLSVCDKFKFCNNNFSSEEEIAFVYLTKIEDAENNRRRRLINLNCYLLNEYFLVEGNFLRGESC